MTNMKEERKYAISALKGAIKALEEMEYEAIKDVWSVNAHTRISDALRSAKDARDHLRHVPKYPDRF